MNNPGQSESGRIVVCETCGQVVGQNDEGACDCGLRGAEQSLGYFIFERDLTADECEELRP